MKKLPTNHLGHFERVRNNIIRTDLTDLDDVLVLEMVLQGVLRRADTNELAHNLLARYKTFKDLYQKASIQDLEKIPGIGQTIALKLCAILKTYQYATSSSNQLVTKDYFSCIQHLKSFFNNYNERLVAGFLNKQGDIIKTVILSEGDNKHVQVDLKDLVTEAKLCRSNAVILAHNHVDGAFFPSVEDIRFTAKAYNYLTQHNTKLIDHLIFSQKGTFSFETTYLLNSIINRSQRETQSPSISYSIF